MSRVCPNQNKPTADSSKAIAVENEINLRNDCSTLDSLPALLDKNGVIFSPINNDTENVKVVLTEANVNDSQVQNNITSDEEMNVADINAVQTKKELIMSYSHKQKQIIIQDGPKIGIQL